MSGRSRIHLGAMATAEMDLGPVMETTDAASAPKMPIMARATLPEMS